MKILNIFLLLLTLIFIFISQQKSYAQYNVTRSVFSNGFLKSSNDTYIVNSTIGQPAIGKSFGDLYNLNSGIITTTAIKNVGNIIPLEYKLYKNYPNPFNSNTKIRYQVPKTTHVKLSIYNLSGHLIKVLVNEKNTAGIYAVNFDASDLSSGFYFYKIETSDFKAVEKCLFLK